MTWQWIRYSDALLMNQATFV